MVKKYNRIEISIDHKTRHGVLISESRILEEINNRLLPFISSHFNFTRIYCQKNVWRTSTNGNLTREPFTSIVSYACLIKPSQKRELARRVTELGESLLLNSIRLVIFPDTGTLYSINLGCV